MINAEANYVAEALDVGVRCRQRKLLPCYKRPLSRAESEVLSDYALRGGNSYVQLRNSGVPGSKLKPITGSLDRDPLVQRLGLENWEEFKGLSYIAST